MNNLTAILNWKNLSTSLDLNMATPDRMPSLYHLSPHHLRFFKDGPALASISFIFVFSYELSNHLELNSDCPSRRRGRWPLDHHHGPTISVVCFAGEFKVKLPDGRLQITSYLADDDGYRPQVTYTYDGDADVPIIVKRPPVLPGNNTT